MEYPFLQLFCFCLRPTKAFSVQPFEPSENADATHAKEALCLLSKPPRKGWLRPCNPKQVRLAAIIPDGAFFSIFKAADYVL